MKINYNALLMAIWPGVCSVFFAVIMKHSAGPQSVWVWNSFLIVVGIVYVFFYR